MGETAGGPVACYEPRGALTYLNADALEEQMKGFLGLRTLVIAMDKVYCVDVDGVDRVGKMVKRLREEGATVVMCGCGGKGVEMLVASEWMQELQEEGFVVNNRCDAYEMIVSARDGKDADSKLEVRDGSLPPAQITVIELQGGEGTVTEPSSPVL